MICSLCDEKASYLPCKGRMMLKKDTEKKIITAKNYRMHSGRTEVKGRSKFLAYLEKA